jgi:putative DNA primase/helicase
MKKTIDLTKWCAPQKEFIVKDWLSVEDISFLKGERGVGKSLLAQQLMTAVATGKPWLNMDVKQVKAYGIFCGDEKEDLIRKQRAINSLYQVDESLVESQMQMLARSGEDNLLMTFNYGGELTTFFHEVLEDIRSFRPKLVVLDTASDLFQGGDSSHFEQFIQVC